MRVDSKLRGALQIVITTRIIAMDLGFGVFITSISIVTSITIITSIITFNTITTTIMHSEKMTALKGILAPEW